MLISVTKTLIFQIETSQSGNGQSDLPPEREISEAFCNKTQLVKLFNGAALLTSASEIALNNARFRRRKFTEKLLAIIVLKTFRSVSAGVYLLKENVPPLSCL